MSIRSLADVLIVTVTRTETRAVLTAFESVTGQKAQPLSMDGNVYRNLGTVNGARVFLALSEMGSVGPGSSQQAVAKGIAALHPSAVIMVGIAFGVDDRKQAIGDILVSRQLMLYDAQRVSATKLVPRGDRVHCSAKLLNYLTSAELDWTGPTVRFGLILTGDKLVDNVDYRDQLRTLEVEAIGGEMEGAGLYVACQDAKVDWVLVKAICDWADGNKAQDKDARQAQAAKHAAEFVAYALGHAALTSSAHATVATAPANTQHQEVGSINVSGSGNTVVVQQGPRSVPAASASPAARSAAGERNAPTRASLRALLGEVLRTSSDLQAFLVDWFPDVARRTSSGMNRTLIENLLLELYETDEILAKLREHDGARVTRYESLLKYAASEAASS